MSKKLIPGGCSKLGLYAFRMPLNTYNGQAFMDYSFKTVVSGAPLDGNESFAQLLYALMVGTVCNGFIAIEIPKEGTFLNTCTVVLVAV